ncbi:MAG: hypothetical protein I3J02_12210 [Prevotella sp.]|nr:hypothetical protein [Prevotella sp.]
MNRHSIARLTQRVRRRKILFILCLLGATLLLMLLSRLLPPTETEMRRSACMIEGHTQLCLIAGRDTIVLHSDSVNQQGVWINRHWWWPSCDGRVLTVEQGCNAIHHSKTTEVKQLAHLLVTFTDSIGRLVNRKDVEKKELEYYLRSHGVQDEGYTRIAQYADLQTKETDSLKRIYDRLTAFKTKANLKLAQRYLLRVAWFNNDGQLEQAQCLPLVSEANHQGRPMIVHTLRSIKPWGAYAVRNLIWGGADHKEIVTVTLVPQDTITPHHALLATGLYIRGGKHNIPKLFARDGSPVFTRHGQFIGIISNQEVKK